MKIDDLARTVETLLLHASIALIQKFWKNAGADEVVHGLLERREREGLQAAAWSAARAPFALCRPPSVLQSLRYGFFGMIVCSIAMVLSSIGASPTIGPLQVFGFSPGDYSVTLDDTHGAQSFVEIAAVKVRNDDFGAAGWAFDPAPWRGKRIRISAQLKTTGEVLNATLFARIDSPKIMFFDGPTESLTDSDAPNRRLHGEQDWTTTYIVLDVPRDATTILAGTLLQGAHGSVYGSLPQITVVGDDVATTGTQIAASAAPIQTMPPFDPGRRAVLVKDIRKALTPITTTGPAAFNADTQPILQAIGTAGIVGLGEATHGTAEFFNLKDRLFRDLVRQRGITVFAIEAPQPEVREMDRYVATGAGDPRRAVRSLQFTVWNTEEMLALARWMRTYNATRGNKPALHFAGFDMQSPVVASRSVVAAIGKVSPDAEKRAAGNLACIRRPYAALLLMSDSAWQTCQTSIDSIGPLVSRYVSDADARHDFVILKQYAQLASSNRHQFDAGVEITAVRDKSMADNVTWLADVRYPGQKFVLWAHNAHIADRPVPVANMGSILAQRFGKKYYRLGFAFDGGSVRAFVGKKVMPVSVQAASPDSFDGILHSTDVSVFYLNLDHLPSAALTQWLDAPAWHREIGGFYNAKWAAAYVQPTQLRVDFDGLIFVDRSHESKSLVAIKKT